MENKTCRECHKPLGPGRIDRKFCSDSCRTEYNNKSRRGIRFSEDEDGFPLVEVSHEHAIKHIQQVLINNREIFKQIPVINPTTIAVERLEDLGFNFNYCSSARIVNGKLHRFCYDFGYYLHDEGTITAYWDENELIDLPFK